jgi:hypothetical protein
MNIIEAMEGPFSPWFPGHSWAACKAVLGAAFALPLSDDQLATFKALAGGREPPRRRVKELWIVAGRRSGKDSVASALAAWSSGIEESHIGRLRPGDMASVLCIATDRDQAKIISRYTQSYFTAIDELSAKVKRETAIGLELDNAAEIVIATNSYRQARGRAVLLALLDECAFYRDETSASPDIEVYRAILPGLATIPESMLVAFSSPYRKAGLLYEKWKTHFGQSDDSVLVIQAESRQLNPTLDPQIVANAMKADPAAAMAEWLGQFRDDIGGYVSIELIESAVDLGVLVRPPREGILYSGFIDAASGTGKDSFAVGIAHRENDAVVLDVAHEIAPPFNPQNAMKEVAKLLKSYGIHRVRGDKYAAGFVIEAAARCGLRYEYSENDRSAIYIEALPLFTSGRARLIDSEKLVRQFATLERRTSVTGRDRVDHGRDGHDDLCNAAAGAMVAVGLPLREPPRAMFGTFSGPYGSGGDWSVGNPAQLHYSDRPAEWWASQGRMHPHDFAYWEKKRGDLPQRKDA